MLRLEYIRDEGDEKIYRCFLPTCGSKSLSINSVTGLWHCWKCNAGGGPKKLMKLLKAPEVMTRRRFLDHLGVEGREQLNTPGAASRKERLAFFHDQCIPLPSRARKARPAMHYLRRERGISEEQMAAHRLLYCVEGKEKGRVVVPIFPPELPLEQHVYPSLREAVYYIARILSSDTLERYKISPLRMYGSWEPPKYLFPKKADWGKKSHWVFNAFRARQHSRIFVCEGVFDVLGRDDRVAIFGKYLSDHQRRILRRMAKSGVNDATALLDPDALRESDKLALQMRRIFKSGTVRAAALLSGDPGEVSEEEVREAERKGLDVTGGTLGRVLAHDRRWRNK